jgi:hypothetical protein
LHKIWGENLLNITIDKIAARSEPSRAAKTKAPLKLGVPAY